MALIEWLQAIAPPLLISFACPLLIIGCCFLAFGYWLYPKWRTAGVVYALSLITSYFANPTTDASDRSTVLIKSILVPTVYSFFFVLWGAARSLRLPYEVPPYKKLPIDKNSRRRRDRSQNLLVRLGDGVLAACVGGIIGAALGTLLSFIAIALLALLALSPIAPDDRTHVMLANAVLDGGIYTLGGIGIGIGLLAGLKRLNVQQISQKMLIQAVIYSAVTIALCRKLLRTLPRTSNLEITVQGDTLKLRHRAYRASDWVWIGFNGLYDLFALFVLAIALLRSTWITMALSINLILILGLLWTWYSLTRVFNHTTITLNPSLLIRLETPFLSVASPIRIPLQKVTAIKALSYSALDPNLPDRKMPRSSGYHVYASLTDGRRIFLLKHLDRWEEALFIEEKIARFRAQQGASRQH